MKSTSLAISEKNILSNIFSKVVPAGRESELESSGGGTMVCITLLVAGWGSAVLGNQRG